MVCDCCAMGESEFELIEYRLENEERAERLCDKYDPKGGEVPKVEVRSTALSPEGEDGAGGISTPISSIFCEFRESDFELSRDVMLLFLPPVFSIFIEFEDLELSESFTLPMFMFAGGKQSPLLLATAPKLGGEPGSPLLFSDSLPFTAACFATSHFSWWSLRSQSVS